MIKGQIIATSNIKGLICHKAEAADVLGVTEYILAIPLEKFSVVRGDYNSFSFSSKGAYHGVDIGIGGYELVRYFFAKLGIGDIFAVVAYHYTGKVIGYGTEIKGASLGALFRRGAV